MATCPKCNKSCPDTAAHCGFCGAALAAAPVSKKTMFGYAAPAGGRTQPAPAPHRPRQPAPVSTAPAPVAPAPIAPAPMPTPIVPTPIEPGPVRSGRTAGHAPAEAMAKTQYSMGGQGSPLSPELAQQGMPAPAALRRSQPHPTQPPAESAIPATLYSPAAPASRQVPPTSFAPAASQVPATTFSPAAQPAVPATVLRPAAEPVPATVFSPAAAPVVVESAASRSDVSRPVLASQTLREDLAPIEPGKGAMRVLMTIGGLLLIGLFCAPWGMAGGNLVFSWDQLKHLGGLEFVGKIYLGAGGLIFVVAGLLPLPYLLRALTAALLGLVPIGVAMAQIQDWRVIVALVALVLLPAALFHRWRYRDSILARILVGLGVAGLLATFLIPSGGGMPLVQTFVGLGDADASVIVTRLYPLLLFLLSLLSLLAFLGSGSTGLVQVWAVLLLLFLPTQSLILALLSLSAKGSIFLVLPKVYGALALLVCLTLSALGISHLLAKGSQPPAPE